MNSRIKIFIPARVNSQRLPGKLLLNATGKSLLHHTYEAVEKAFDQQPYVVTSRDPSDDVLCRDVANFGGTIIRTKDYDCGTDRVAAAFMSLSIEDRSCIDWVCNIQGDEPEITRDTVVDLLHGAARSPIECQISTVACVANQNEWSNPNCVKVVTNHRNEAMYFSRSMIPAYNNAFQPCGHIVHRHIGIYCYRPQFLYNVYRLAKPHIATVERLEQLTWLWYGYKIIVEYTNPIYAGINTQEDYDAFVQRIKGV